MKFKPSLLLELVIADLSENFSSIETLSDALALWRNKAT
jgi:hypothetical protein